jgi:hypothetical protein
LGFGGGYSNLHEYVDNNPINAIDPTGLQTIVIVTGDGLIGEHAGIWVGRGSGDDPVLYDPGGHYRPAGGTHPSGDAFYGNEADLDRFIETHRNWGETVRTYEYPTTAAQEARIGYRIEHGRDPGLDELGSDDTGGSSGGACAFSSAAALRGVGPFSRLGRWIFTPKGLARSLPKAPITTWYPAHTVKK